jgi:serine/threonine protein kinase
VQRIYLEVLTCKTLSHPNVIQVFGIHNDPDHVSSYIVTPWMKNRNVRKHLPFLKTNSSGYSTADVLTLAHSWVSTYLCGHIPLMLITYLVWQIEDVAQGVLYMHQESLAHGDIRGVRS